MSAMEYKIRKLKTVGLRQNAPEAAATRIDPALLHKAMFALGGSSLLAFAAAMIAVPRSLLLIVPLGLAAALAALD